MHPGCFFRVAIATPDPMWSVLSPDHQLNKDIRWA